MLTFCKRVFFCLKGYIDSAFEKWGLFGGKNGVGAIRNGRENIISLDFYLFCKHFFVFLPYRERNKGERQYKLIYFSHSLFFSFDRIIIFLFFQVFFFIP